MYGIIIFIFQLCAKALLVEGYLKLASSVSTFEGLNRTTGLNGLMHDHVKNVKTLIKGRSERTFFWYANFVVTKCLHT
jgi:hypothetical protein